jgi:hypothetical protein
LACTDQPFHEPPGQGITGCFGSPNHPDVGPTLERIGEPMVPDLHGGHNGHIPHEQFHDRRTEGGRG